MTGLQSQGGVVSCFISKAVLDCIVDRISIVMPITCNFFNPLSKPFNVYSNAETNRLMGNAPPWPLVPFQEVTETEFPSLNGPSATTKTKEQEEKQPNESSQEDTLVFVSESRGIIPLQDLDDEPDMMKEESDSPSEVALEPNLQSPEATEAVVENAEEVAESSQETPAEDGGGEEAHEEVDEGFEHGTPLNYFGANEVEGKLLVPEGCVRIEYQPQPKPPSPVEVSDVDTMSPPPPSCPPPLPHDEVGGEMRDEGVGQEFLSPPPEILPSPPPELTDDFEK